MDFKFSDVIVDDDGIRLIIDKYSRILKDYCSDILSGNYDILPEVEKLRKEYYSKHRYGFLL
ncbi:hypothetical protein [Clostridium thailandense]|uniref:hypothetical protein n=1 Tax=Clostridium thailandense TaxID=2794346 RepID=UPI0039895A0A